MWKKRVNDFSNEISCIAIDGELAVTGALIRFIYYCINKLPPQGADNWVIFAQTIH